MYPKLYLSSLATLITVGLTSPINAAAPLALHQASLSEISQKFQLSIPGLIQSAQVSTDSLRFVKQHTDKKKVTHIRMQQYFSGFPVFGGYAIIHSTNNANLLGTGKNDSRMNGTLYQDLFSELGQPDASFVANGSAVLEEFKTQFIAKNPSEEQVTPMIYIDENHQAHWAYKVSIFIDNNESTSQRPTAIIDAQSKKTFVQWDDVKTILSAVKGTGFGGNEKIGEYQFGLDLPLLNLTRDDAKELCFMENTDVKVVDMEHKAYSNNKPMQFSCSTSAKQEPNTYLTGYFADGYDKVNGAVSPSNDALYNGDVIKRMYRDWYNVEALVKPDGTPMQLVMRVHFKKDFGNASWNGKYMTFGDGDKELYPLVSLGIASHEVSHGFTEHHSGLEYFGQSGGMNEAFSDMAAQAAELYSTGKQNWQIGPEILKEKAGIAALRYMDKPSQDGYSIDTADDYYGGLDVHYSSGVFNRLFYLLSNQPNWNLRMAFDVMVKANMDYWTPFSNFDEGGCGVLNAAKDLEYPIDEIKKSLAIVKINYRTCFNE